MVKICSSFSKFFTEIKSVDILSFHLVDHKNSNILVVVSVEVCILSYAIKRVTRQQDLCKRYRLAMLLVQGYRNGGAGGEGVKAPQTLQDQLTLSHPGGRLCPPHHYSPLRIFRPSYGRFQCQRPKRAYKIELMPVGDQTGRLPSCAMILLHHKVLHQSGKLEYTINILSEFFFHRLNDKVGTYYVLE